MHKRSSKKEEDVNQIAAEIVQIVADAEPPKEKNPAAVALGRLGGLKGGHARALKLSKKRKKQIASNAAKARWNPPERKSLP